MKKVLVLGASGMIGHRLWWELQDSSIDLRGTLRRNQESYIHFPKDFQNVFQNILTSGQFYYGVDATHWKKIQEILDEFMPDEVINGIGITIRKPEINDPEQALQVNSFFPQRLKKWAQENKKRVIHLSTDCVFDGSEGRYSEISQPSAKDTYGKTKFLGEVEGDFALTLRFSCIGRELEGHTELLEWFLAQKGKKVRGFDHVLYSGLTTSIIAQEVKRLIVDFPKLTGLFQLSSSPISKYDLLCLIKKVYGLDIEIEKVSDEKKVDKTLLSSKYQKTTGFVAPQWETMISGLYQQGLDFYRDF